MNSTQNKKIEQVKETTMIVGIDVGSEKHYFRAFNWRGIELTRKPVPFSNSMEGFNSFYNTVVELMQENKLEEAMVGIEPTGHYWFDLGQFMGEKDIKFVMVNPHHVHKTKELDDNSPSKNDRKDPRVIAGLVKDGRYFYSYMPTGIYAELRNASNRRFVLVEEQQRAKNRLQKWIAVYFPEYKGIYTHIDAKGGLLVLKQAPLPEEIVKLGVEGIIKIWKDAKLRGNGHKKAMLILNAAMSSIGLKTGLTEARMEIQDLIEDYELQTKRLERVNDLIKELCLQIKHVDKLLEIKEREHLEKIEDIKGVQKEIAWGSQIRSYVFMPYTMAKDHRTGFESGNINGVMDGDLDGFINAYLKASSKGELQNVQ